MLPPPMLPEEPPHGIYMRLADRNGVMRITEFQNMTSVKLRHVRVGRDLDQLAAMLRCDVEDISKYSITHVKRRQSVIVGQKVQRRDDLMMTQRRVCPDCLVESLHHRYWWDLDFITTCTSHGRPLIYRCECGCALTWKDANIAKCYSCEAGDVRNSPFQAAPSEVLELDQWALNRLRGERDIEIPVVSKLPLGRAIETIERVGALAIGGYKTHWQEIDDFSEPSSKVRALGFAVLRKGNLDDLLDQIYAGFLASKKTAKSLKTIYGWFWHWFSYRGADRFSAELAEIIYRNASAKIQVTRKAFPTIARESETITLVETAKICRRRHGTIRMLLSSEGLIRPIRQKGSPIRIKLSDAHRLATDLADSVSLTELGAIIGVGQTALVKLVRSNRVPVWIRGGTKTKHQYIFRRKDVDRWLNSLVGTPPLTAKAERRLVSIADAPRAANLPINSIVDALTSGAIRTITATHPKRNFSNSYVDLDALRQHRSKNLSSRLDPMAKYQKLAGNTSRS